MRLPILPVLFASAALFVASCSSTGETRTENIQKSPRVSGLNEVQAGEGYWSDATYHMTGKERESFFGLSSVDEREKYIAARGIDVRIAMAQRLSPGMSREECVSALEGVYDREVSDNTTSNRLFFSKYNGASSTQMYCTFTTDGRLASWGSYINSEIEQEARLAVAELELKRRLDTFLSVGMGESEVLNSARQMQEQLADFNKAIEERITSSTYKGSKASSNNNYALESDILRIQAMADFFNSVTFRPSHRERQGTLETWYNVTTHEETGIHTVVRYVFDGAKLQSWEVYHTDFLGFLASKG